jgi:heme/copper-type cytochrome/quinol oxidase subunit 3
MSTELATYVSVDELDHLVPPPPARPNVLVVATLLASAAVLAGYLALIAVYLGERAATLAEGSEWLPQGAIGLTTPNLMLTGFGLSLVFMHWSVQAIGNDDRRHAWLALALVLVVGAFYFTGTAFMFNQSGLAVASPVGGLVYAAVGAHLAITGAGLAYAGVMAFRTLGGQYSSKDREGLVSATVFWWVVSITYAVLWYAIYITK